MMENKKDKYYRLTNPEMRIWYNEKIYQQPAIHNIGGYVQLTGTIDLTIMDQAINNVIKEHDGFRIAFVEEKGIPYQYVKPYEYKPILVKDFSGEENPEDAFQIWVNSLMPNPFDLSKGELYQFAICKTGKEETRVFLKIHHIIADGWSIQLIAELITKEYYHIKGDVTESGEAYSYLDYLDSEEKYFNSARFEKNETYWLEQFSDVKEMNLLQSSKGINGIRRNFELSKEETSILKQFADSEQVLLQTAVMAAYYLYRSACLKQKDIAIGIPVFNRYGRKEKNTVGMFTSTMVYRYCIDDTLSVSEYVQQMNRKFMQGLKNQKYPYNKLIEELKKLNNSIDSMFDVSINYYNTDFNKCFKEWNASFEECYSGYQFFDLQIVIKEWSSSGKMAFSYDYKTDKYNEFQIEELHQHIKGILLYMQQHRDEAIRNVPVFQEYDNARFIVDYNHTSCPYPKEKTILQLFEEVVTEHPEQIAIEYQDSRLTYKELDEQANKLANYLYHNLGARNKIVGIKTLHSIESVVAILAVMKAGYTYLPLEPGIPEERLDYIVKNSGLTLLLTNFESNIKHSVKTINIHDIDLTGYSSEKPEVEASASIVYIIYTSGTTGRPKGVMITQQGLVNYIYWAKKAYHVTMDDSFALYSSLAFDLTVTSIFTPLISGARILVYRDDQEKYVLYRIVEENRTSILKLTPAHLKLIMDMDVSGSILNRFVVGGEDLKHQLAHDIYQKFNKKMHIYNEYGPTETVVGCMIYEYDESKCYGTSVPIGIPSDNVQIYLLGDDLKPVLPGEEGEMYIAGDGVAKGYLNQEELTRERFIKNPFSEDNRYMYKTGDIARFVSEDVMEYICRADNQIKVNGYRIELGEIEECIKKLEGVTEAVVDYLKLPNGNQVLCAFYTGSDTLDAKTLRNHARKYLPDYMVPVYYTLVSEFKLTVNGKLDRCNLPKIDMEEKVYASDLDVEKTEILSNIVKTILNVQQVNMNDNFYSIGGDSIKAIQLTSRLSEAGYKVKMKDVLSSICLGEIVELMEDANEELYAVENCSGSLKNIPIYQWFLDMRLENPDYYVQSVRIHLDKSVSARVLSKALGQIIKTHDAFRLNYSEEEGFFYQEKYLQEEFQVKCLQEDLDLEASIVAEKRCMDIQNKLPFQALFVERSQEDQNLLILIAHHIVVDGVSWRIIADDLYKLLEQEKEGRELRLIKEFATINQWYAAMELYQDTALQQNTYWKKQIEPYAMSKHWQQDYEKEDLVKDNISSTIEINQDMSSTLLQQVTKKQNFSISEILLTAVIQIFTKKYQENEMVVLLESHGREGVIGKCDLSRTVGWFTSMYPVRFAFKDIEDSVGMLDEVKTSLKQIPDHGVGFGVLSYMKRVLEDRQQHIRFNYLGDIADELTNNWIRKIEPDFKHNSDSANKNSCLMDINCIHVDGKLLVDFTCNRRFMNQDELEAVGDCFKENLKELVYELDTEDSGRVLVSEFTAVSLSQDEFDDLFE